MTELIKQFLNKKTWLILGFIFLVELASFFAYLYPSLNLYIFLAIILGASCLAYRNFKYLFFISLIELVIGSQGHLFSVELLSSYNLSIRIALWALMFLFLAGKLIKEFSLDKIFKNKSIFKFRYLSSFISLMLFVVLGLIIGVASSHDLTTIFSDFNAWLFLLWLFPVIYIFKKNPGKKIIYETANIFIIASLYLICKSFFFLFIFSHDFIPLMKLLYPWTRHNYLGEITALKADFYRIFFQSHIYSLAGLIISWVVINREKYINLKTLKLKKNLFLLIFFILNLSVVILSLSRSLWLGLVVFLALFFLFNLRKWGFISVLKRSLLFFISLILALFIIAFVVKIPISGQSGDFSAKDIFKERSSLEKDSGAISSRWSLLPLLKQEIVKNPVFGQGFGKEITYISQDPRVLENNPSGKYTTYAFEWAWLDIWLKIGLLGLLAYLYLLYKLIRDSFMLEAHQPYIKALAWSLLAVAVVNVFTPYLNHPLGLSFLIITSILIARAKNKVYDENQE